MNTSPALLSFLDVVATAAQATREQLRAGVTRAAIHAQLPSYTALQRSRDNDAIGCTVGALDAIVHPDLAGRTVESLYREAEAQVARAQDPNVLIDMESVEPEPITLEYLISIQRQELARLAAAPCADPLAALDAEARIDDARTLIDDEFTRLAPAGLAGATVPQAMEAWHYGALHCMQQPDGRHWARASWAALIVVAARRRVDVNALSTDIKRKAASILAVSQLQSEPGLCPHTQIAMNSAGVAMEFALGIDDDFGDEIDFLLAQMYVAMTVCHQPARQLVGSD